MHNFSNCILHTCSCCWCLLSCAEHVERELPSSEPPSAISCIANRLSQTLFVKSISAGCYRLESFVRSENLATSTFRFRGGSASIRILYTCVTPSSVIGNLASLGFGTPTQNTLEILETPSKIRWGILAPCGAPLGEFGIPQRLGMNRIAWPWCQSWLTCVTIWRACGVLLVTFNENPSHGGLCSADRSSVGKITNYDEMQTT